MVGRNGKHQLPAGARPTSADGELGGFRRVIQGDARNLAELADHSVDLVVTSPPYWRKRDYRIAGQLGQESNPEEYVEQLILAIREWCRVLRPHGSIFLNIGDTYWRKSLAGIPSRVESRARDDLGLVVRNRIVWVKQGGLPDPARDRLTARHEYVLHFALNGYYYDLFGYAERYSLDGRGANPGDVWQVARKHVLAPHLAPFPPEIAERAILLACPPLVCTRCGQPQRRRVRRTAKLDQSRPQARRALELVKQHGLTSKHIEAIQATGISDAGKARRVQSGTNRNSKEVQQLAREAKAALGGYFREFTFSKRETAGWDRCACRAAFAPGVVLDPFMGTGTTLDKAIEMGRSAVGIDLDISQAGVQSS